MSPMKYFIQRNGNSSMFLCECGEGNQQAAINEEMSLYNKGAYKFPEWMSPTSFTFTACPKRLLKVFFQQAFYGMVAKSGRAVMRMRGIARKLAQRKLDQMKTKQLRFVTVSVGNTVTVGQVAAEKSGGNDYGEYLTSQATRQEK